MIYNLVNFYLNFSFHILFNSYCDVKGSFASEGFCVVMEFLSEHLCFKQAQPKMCHSPLVDDGVEIYFFTSYTHIFGQFWCKNFKLP